MRLIESESINNAKTFAEHIPKPWGFNYLHWRCITWSIFSHAHFIASENWELRKISVMLRKAKQERDTKVNICRLFVEFALLGNVPSSSRREQTILCVSLTFSYMISFQLVPYFLQLLTLLLTLIKTRNLLSLVEKKKLISIFFFLFVHSTHWIKTLLQNATLLMM